MTFLLVGRGSELPFGATWADKAEGLWMREATRENVENEIAKSNPMGVTSWRFVDKADIPVDRTYRNALKDDGSKLSHDIVKARELHREKLRHARAKCMCELDAEYMKALGTKDVEAEALVEAKRQALRDLPADPRIEAARDVTELKALWPVEELGVIS